MSNTAKKLFRGAASTSETTLYTTPASTTTIVTNIVISNTDSADATFTINLGGVEIASSTVVSANSLAAFDIKQVIDATDTISGLASTTLVNFHISGVEVV